MTGVADRPVIPPRDPATLSRAERWATRLGPDGMRAFLAASTAKERDEVFPFSWESLWARPSQLLPEGDWDLWMIRAGRGFGKTRSGGEGCRKLVNSGRARYVTFIGPTAADARDVMIEGPSGVLAVHPPDVRPRYEPSKRLVSWPNGAEGHVRSAEDPDSLRGLNSDLVWGDEPASWKYGEESWDNAMLGNRVGRPHAILTGTPRPLPWLRKLEEKPGTRVSTGATYENITNLAGVFIALIIERYEGTRLGAQELHAKYLEDVEGALWRLATIEAGRFLRFELSDPWHWLAAGLVSTNPAFGRGLNETFPLTHRRWRTVVSVDPPGETAECGITVGAAPIDGIAGRDHAVVLDDVSLVGAPEVWGPAAVAAYRTWDAEELVVEANQGGDMVRSTIHAADPTVNVTKIRAVDSKADRAEPISVLYSKGWIHHLGHLAKLEDQQTTWVPAEGKSPDRIDSVVHLLTHLLRPTTIAPASLPDQFDLARTRL